MPQLITIFGGSGFIGRHVVAKLAKTGARIRVAVRNPHLATRVFPMGDPGQIATVRCNVANEAQVAAALKGADTVINLVGILAEWGDQNFDAIQSTAAADVAAQAKAAGVKTFVQMSSIGADPDAESAYARTKGEAERAVLEAFPTALILRPSIVFGVEDGFFNRFGAIATKSPFLPLFGGGENKMQPVFVGDVAQALANGLAQGKSGVYELGGPRSYSFQELMDVVRETTGRKPWALPMPFWVGDIVAAVLQWLPGQPLTPDQLKLLRKDNVVTAGAKGIGDLGVTPTPLEAVVPAYMVVYRKEGQFTDLRQE